MFGGGLQRHRVGVEAVVVDDAAVDRDWPAVEEVMLLLGAGGAGVEHGGGAAGNAAGVKVLETKSV